MESQTSQVISPISIAVQSTPAVFLASFVAFYSHRLLVSNKINARDKHDKSVPGSFYFRTLFDLTVGSSFLLIELVLSEICDWLSQSTRVFLWSITTRVLLFMLTFAIPFTVAYVSTISISSRYKRWLILGLSFGAYLYSFYVFGDVVGPAILGSEISRTDRGWMEFCLSRVGFIGITAMSVLAGFAAVSAPYEVFIAKTKPASKADCEKLRHTLTTTNDLLHSKKLQLERLGLQIKDKKQMSTTNLLMLKIVSTITGNETAREYSAIETEIGALEKMIFDLENDLESTEARLKYEEISNTVFGQLHKKIYFFFALYCIYRLFSVLIVRNPIWKRTTSSTDKSDAIVISLAHLAQWCLPNMSVDVLATQIGFTVSGLLFIASISSVLSTLKTLFKNFPMLKKTAQATTGLHMTSILVAQLLGTYVISTSLLLRSNLPQTMSSAISKALRAPLDVPVVDRLSDTTFCIVSVSTIFALWIANRWNQEDENYYDEEMFIGGKRD